MSAASHFLEGTSRLRGIAATAFLAVLGGCASVPELPISLPPLNSLPGFRSESAPATPPATGASETIQSLPSIAKVETASAIAQGDIWVRVKSGFALTSIEHPLVDAQTAYYAQRPDYLKRMFDRSGKYMFHIIEEVERRGMPAEIALLPFIESAFNPQALSSAAASGLWQFIPSTGKRYNMSQDWVRDERRDIIAATKGALDYLQYIHTLHKDWYLALASYNWGEGAVGRAVEANRRAGKGTDYIGIMNRMPRETQNYVPKLQAIKNIVMNPEKYGITLPPVPNAPYFGTVVKTRDIDTKIAAKLADMSLDDFLALNPSFSRPVIPGARQPLIVLPLEKIPVFETNLLAHRGQLSSYQHYEVIEKQRLEAIAKKFKMSESDLKTVNGIPPSHKLVSNGTLLVLKDTALDDAALAKISEVQLPASIGANKALTEDELVMKRFTYKARKNESVTQAAKRFGVSLVDLKSWNSFTGDKLATGQNIVVMRAVRAGSGRVMVAAKNGKSSVTPKRSVKAGKAKVKRVVKRRT